MEYILSFLLPYLISLAANERTSAIAKARERELGKALSKHADIQKAIRARKSLTDDIRAACIELARNLKTFNIPPHEQPLWNLLSDGSFQDDLILWLRAGSIAEGAQFKARVSARMEDALNGAGADSGQIEYLRSRYFDEIDKALMAHPVLAHWRHQLTLEYLREQVTALRLLAEEAAGTYSEKKRTACLSTYCQKALAEWDIIDLSNLPEGDVHIATQKLLLRQLYMPLRVSIEKSDRADEKTRTELPFEEERNLRRRRESGRVGDKDSLEEEAPTLSAFGEILSTANRLVVLGDPGGGKTTLLRWLATAYLLRHTGDPSLEYVPDADSLPRRDWIPVLIRCRDLGEADLCRSFSDFLAEHLKKTELKPEEARVMVSLVLEGLSHGSCLLLVDGLDEITNPRIRVMFCQELERTAARYPQAPIVVTSRIVGYRDMPFRMGSGFSHGAIAELTVEDKDRFAERWIELTEQHQPLAERQRRLHELIEALHSTNRIERLTGNPMLLTTLALVKRKVGKLPNRRTKLYSEAVAVLLNWNPRMYSTIEEEEAIPQLEYLAYEMCRRGVQRLTGDEVLDLLDKLRLEYPNVRSVRKRDPETFLKLLEERSSILIRSGGIWIRDSPEEKPVWEFRHLTFQEYLAARALLDGRYPGRNKAVSLAAQVASLAVASSRPRSEEQPGLFDGESAEDDDAEIPESWREAIRLLVADCSDDDVDEVMLAILNPLPGEDSAQTSRPRAVLATLCLADEPNVSEESARQVLCSLAAIIDERDGHGSEAAGSSLDSAVFELKNGLWFSLLKHCIVGEYLRRTGNDRWNVGGVWSTVAVASIVGPTDIPATAMQDLVAQLNGTSLEERVSAALTIMGAAYEEKASNSAGLTASLLRLLSANHSSARHAAAWACGWLCGAGAKDARRVWTPDESEVQQLLTGLESARHDHEDTRRYLIWALDGVQSPQVTRALLRILRETAERPSTTVHDKDKHDVDEDRPIIEHRLSVATAAAEALAHQGVHEAAVPLAEFVSRAGEIAFRTIIDALFEWRVPAALPALQRARDKVFQDNPSDKNFVALAVLCAYLETKSEADPPWHFAITANPEGRTALIRELKRHRDPTDKKLLSTKLWAQDTAFGTEIGDADATKLGEKLKISAAEVRERYASIASDFHLL